MADVARHGQDADRKKRPDAPTSTPTSAPRGVLFGQLLRAGPDRAGPIFDKLDPAGIAAIVKLLSPSELTLCAALVGMPVRAARTATLPLAVLVTLARAARPEDRARLLKCLPPDRAQAVLAALDEGRFGRGERGMGLVLRLRRLFRR